MNKELKLFFTALSFYSRLPAPASIHQNNAHSLPDSIRYLPVVGWIVGMITAIVFMGTAYLFGETIAVLLAMVASVLLTGAFHEDGFADVCDGFGGGWAKEKILLIMKDSRLGTYGVVGLLLLMGLKFAALLQLFTETFIYANTITTIGLFIVAHSLSRFAAITVVFNHSYARIEESKASGAVEKGRQVNLIAAGIFTLIPLVALTVYLAQPVLLMIIVPVLLFSLYLGAYYKKWIGGYTGDCLGAVQQLTEVIIYLSYILIWKFI
ncbi:adenosylcobinamide-GDP ribazoletransferase [Pedobacter cryoconitis]|uniref:adenosylcobinamide-GDP ribazoletransferase n=1 Tax=Pedobacter cryoconitis TaxID=188932 RepID=UPI00160BF134|nr:adenosylcobinamide-GDP ribazoletransferase [Pedobacter cryoconitis]MBB6270351.1 adenosylcobinamide-GDP ribazoletransferase [Pedobacter cryoconitis]